MNRLLAGKILLASFLLFFAATAPGWAANGEIEKGEELYRQGQTEDAYRLLMRAVFRDPENPANTAAFHTLARIFLDRDQPDRALAILSRIPEKNRRALTRILRGNALLRSGYVEEAFSQLQRLAPDELPAAEGLLYFETLAAGKERRGQTMEALFFYHQALVLAVHEHDRRRLLVPVSRIAQEIAGTPESGEARFMFQETVTGHVLNLREAEKLAQAGHNREALGLLQPVLESPVEFPYRPEAADLYRRITGTIWERRHTIGVLLPLSGQYAAYGKMVRRGMELVLEPRNGDLQGGIRFLFRDTGADPERTVAAVKDLCQQEKVTALLGPLSGRAAEAGARQAQQEGVPLLALSPRQGLPEIGSWIFRTSLTGESQINRLLRYAVAEKGLNRFAILYPADNMGREFADLFARQAVTWGGRIVVSRSYPVSANDFRGPILQLLGNNPVSGRRAPFDALFIPDYGERVGLLASQLPYYDIEGVLLLGTHSWNSPELVTRGGKALEGAVFTDGFFADSPHPQVRNFVRSFRERHEESPSILDAQGYDAVALLLSLLADSRVRTRQDLQEGIRQVRDFPGITGNLSFRENGEGEKSLYLLRIREGAVEQID